MSKNRRTIADPFHDRMRRGERILLLIYLPIHIFAMPALLALLMTHMGIEYTEITLNFLYYAAGAVLVFLIARRFLRAEFDPLCDNWMKVLLSVLEGVCRSCFHSRCSWRRKIFPCTQLSLLP